MLYFPGTICFEMLLLLFYMCSLFSCWWSLSSFPPHYCSTWYVQCILTTRYEVI
jgi:hypothetical protein